MLRTLPIDPTSLAFVSAGQPEAVMIWAEENGRRVLTDRQDKNDDGVPLWTCYVMPTTADRPEVIQLRVAAHQQPVLQQFGAVTLVGLEVNVRVDKAGKLAQYWSAAEVRDGAHHGRGKPAEQAA